MSAQSMYQAGKESIKNFSREENEWLTRVGPGTLMGNLFRQYWIPVTPAADLTEPGARPIRVKLLGEDLVLFRALNGQIGMIGAFCSHRLAPLFFEIGRASCRERVYISGVGGYVMSMK